VNLIFFFLKNLAPDLKKSHEIVLIAWVGFTEKTGTKLHIIVSYYLAQNTFRYFIYWQKNY